MSDYTELVKALRETDGEPICPCPYDNMCEDKDCIIYQAADAIEELASFAHFVANEVMADDEEWENIQDAFPEIACRWLNKLGIVGKDGGLWHYEPPKEETE